jgi:type IV pilus assembly protein PilY1
MGAIMKRFYWQRSVYRHFQVLVTIIGLGIFLALPLKVEAGLVNLATSPLTESVTSDVLPNLMFVLDDSGSMDWDYMPDQARNFAGAYGFNSSQCNGTYYNPSINYTPPVKSDGTSYPNSNFSAAWRDGYDTAAGTVDLNTGFRGGSGTGASGISLTAGPAFYYTYSGTQTTAAQKDFKVTTNVFYRECNSAIGSTTAVDGSHPVNTLFSKTRLASTPTTTISVSGAGGSGATITINSVGGTRNTRPSVSSIRVNGVELMSGSSASSTNANTVASNIAARITQNGFSATAASNVVTIIGPVGAAGFSPVVTYSGTMSYTTTPFPTVTATTVNSIRVGGVELLASNASGSSTNALAADIAAKITTAGYSATVVNSLITLTGPSSAANLTPVINVLSGTMTLTAAAFPESTPAKLQNFANWYSYYSTRMLMMKTAAGQAFSSSTLSNYRIGFMTMNNNVSPGLVDVAPFVGGCAVGSGTCQKDKWYTKLYASNPGNNTPLREALSHVGQYYAHKFGTVTKYTATITVGGSSATSVESIMVNGVEIMEDASLPGATTAQVAANVAAQINSMLVTDFGAKVTGNVITLFGPASALGNAPLVTSDGGGMTFNTTSFVGSTTTAQLNGMTPADPIQYSCQQNFTILSTDGFWNGATTYDLSNNAVGQQDGTAPRPMSDGALSSYTLTTTYTTVERRQEVTSGAVKTKTWTKTATTAGTDCSVPAGPSGQVSSLTNNGSTMGLTLSATNPAGTGSSACVNLTGNGNANDAWFCRTTVTGASVTDGNGTTWKLVNPIGTNVGCTTNRAAWGASYSTNRGTCPVTAAIAKTNVVTKTYSGTETISGQITTNIYDYSGTQTRVQTVTNGVPGTLGALTPSSPNFGAATLVSSTTSGTIVDTGVPTTWTLTNTSQVCTANPLPAMLDPASGPSVTNDPPAVGGSTSTSIVSTVTTAGVPVQSAVTSSGGTSNTLADVAMYYYQTDLRTPTLGNCTGALGDSVCENNVFGTAIDNQLQQHLTTFTLGLGAQGRMVYSPSYQNDTSGDFKAVKEGCTAGTATTSSPCGSQTSGAVCSWQTSGTTCNWPIPSSGALENIDDLWHAAVNGRGAFFSATNPTTLSAGLSNALASVNAHQGAAAAAATSTLNPVAGNNYAYVASYTSVKWTGNLEARGINTTNGVVGKSAMWCAEDIQGDSCPTPGTIVSSTSGNVTVQSCVTPGQTVCQNGFLDGDGNCTVQMVTSCVGTMMPRVSIVGSPATTTTIGTATINTPSDDRTIYTSNDARTALALFDDAYATSHPSYFGATGLSHYPALTSAQQSAASGVNLLRYLRGQRGLSDSSDTATDGLYRFRAAVLGDALESLPAFLGAPLFSYPYPGYSEFLVNNASRAGTVYMGTNDGMLHAFNASTGQERWAYIPGMVRPNLWKLADRNYATHHVNFVNGNAVTSDICTSNCDNASTAVWKTILVGGLNGGGSGYYALDITNPASPALVWEVSSASSGAYGDLGYSFGQPVVTRKADGTWVVLVTSGYNNTGGGYLYVLNAATGAVISKIPTGAGDSTTPSGLAKIAAWNTAPAGNEAGFVYGGDLLGNVWRFDINSTSSATGANAVGNGAVLKFAVLEDAAGNPQPITTTPILGLVSGKRVVIIGTGKYLEPSDLSTTQTQTIYGIKDDDATTTLVNPRTVLVQQTITQSTSGAALRTASSSTVNFGTGLGWYVDLPESKERVNIDGRLVQGTLLMPTLVPENSACNPAGHGWLNFLNYQSGGAVDSSSSTASTHYDSPIVGTNVMYINGKPVGEVVTSKNPTPTIDENIVFSSGAPVFSGKRVIWRELAP